MGRCFSSGCHLLHVRGAMAWKKATDEHSGDPYWWNTETKEVSWDPPPGEAQQPVPKSQEPSGKAPTSTDPDSVSICVGNDGHTMCVDNGPCRYSEATAANSNLASEPSMEKPVNLALKHRWVTKTYVWLVVLIILFLPLAWMPCCCKWFQEAYVDYPEDYSGPRDIDPDTLDR